MQYEVEFELGDGDEQKETGVMIDVISEGTGCSQSKAVIVLGNQKVITKPLSGIVVVDKEIGSKFQAIEAKHQKLDLPVDIVER
jgi:hypothetical protein